MTTRMRWTSGAILTLALLVLTGFAHSQPTANKPVNLKVQVPHEKAELTIEGTLTKQTGKSRLFISPPLEPGKSYTYSLSVTWDPNNYTKITRTYKAKVKAGETVEVDLTKYDDKNPDKVVVRYVPTPEEVVEAMCKMGGVTKDDVVYDLGCGDGRIVITAVKDHGAKRGVGVDIDPERIKESNENAKKAGVDDKVEFRMEDVLNLKGLADATVVMLYMGDEMNMRLRPILQKNLKPGARIVSHRFLMGDWKPHETKTVMDTYGGEYDIHLWKIEKKD